MLLAVCDFPEAGPEADGPFTVLVGDNLRRVVSDPDGPHWAADEDDDDEDDGYFCNDAVDCAKRCPEPEQDGGTTSCTCARREDGQWYCEVKQYAPGEHPWEEGTEGGEEGAGCGGGDGGIGDDDPLLKCTRASIPISLKCTPNLVERGERVKCEARPLNTAHDTDETNYEWWIDCAPTWQGAGDQCGATLEGNGSSFKVWRGEATTNATVKVRITRQAADHTVYSGVTDEFVSVQGVNWSTIAWRSHASMEYPETKSPPWRKDQWGVFGYARPLRLPYMSTRAGSGPWEGTHYFYRYNGFTQRHDFLYVHPDLVSWGPEYAGADMTCGEDAPDEPVANLLTVNYDCGLGSVFTDFALRVDHHEDAHQQSYNDCVNGGALDMLNEIESMAGDPVEMQGAARRHWKEIWDVIRKAADTPQKEPPTPTMWQYRYPEKWKLSSHAVEWHYGTWGC